MHHHVQTQTAAQVTIVHSRDRLLPGLTVAASAYALRRLIERGAVVHLNARATQVSASSKEWKLSSGTTVSADVAFQVRVQYVAPAAAI
jgi:NADH dehydrogenase FAD-containing subunit